MPHASAPVGQSASEGKTKNSVAPWQIGLCLFALAAVGGSFAMMSRAKPDTDTTPYAAPAPPPDASSGSGPAITVYAEGSAGPAGASAVSPAQPAQPGTMLFTVSLPPKEGVAWGTMAIVPSGTSSNQNAAALAAAACQQAVSGGKWDGLYVYVFSDADSAQKFRQYQSGRGGEPLKSSDYNALQSLWSQVPVRYEYSRGFEAVRYPSKSPGGWWSGSSSFHRAKI